MRGLTTLRRAAVLVLALTISARSACADLELTAPFDGPVRFARVSPVDFLHLRAELRPDFSSRSVEGRVTHRMRARSELVGMLILDAVSMTVSEINADAAQSVTHRVFDDRIEIDLDPPLARDEEFEIVIAYRCRPRKGVYFIDSSEVYPDRPRQIWTQGETEETRHYIPCFDAPSERLTTELLITVPSDMDVLSNGLRISDDDHGDGTRTVHWRQDEPHVSYLISFAAGRYEKLVDSWDGIPISSWHYPGDAERARVSFGETAAMMEFFSAAFGRYPWPKYDQVVVRDFVAGGMENTTATTLTDNTLHEASDVPFESSRGLVAHELAHQWFGDLVTCRDWADVWLNESFATFCEALYVEHAHGRDEAQMVRSSQARAYLGENRRYRRPISCRTYRASNDVFDSHSYAKGGRVLEMLRDRLGDEIFRRAVRAYLTTHAHQSVDARQFERALEEASGESLGAFFEQWIHRGGHPKFTVGESYDADRHRLTLRVAQTQTVDRVTPLFRAPVEIGIHFSGGEEQVERIEVSKAEESFTFVVPTRPSFVRFDRRGVILMELEHEKNSAAWIEQLARDPDVLGRIAAAERLGALVADRDDDGSRAALLDRLALEPFWGVRREIVEALGRGRGPEIEGALARVLADPGADPRVRAAAARALASMSGSGESSLVVLERAFREDSSDPVKEAVLRSYYRASSSAPLALAREALDRPSSRDRIRRAALDILVERDDALSIARILEILGSTITAEFRMQVVRSAARLGARRPQLVDEALARHVADPLVRVRRVVYRALGDLKTQRAREALASRRGEEVDEESKKALSEAIAAADRPSTEDEIGRRIEDLQRRDEELDRRLRELEEAKRGRP
jgi:aminopeptidase N